MKKIERQKENVKTLLELIKDNPDLEIKPLVDSEVVADDDHSWWGAAFGKAEIDEYYCEDDRMYLKSLDWEELIDDQVDILKNDDKLRNLSLSDDQLLKMAEREVEAFPWVKAIVINITTC